MPADGFHQDTRIREGEELEAAMERADQALYQVKEEERLQHSSVKVFFRERKVLTNLFLPYNY